MGLFFNDSQISNEKLNDNQLKRVIQKHLNQSNKYAYVIKEINNTNGDLNIRALARGDSHKASELIIKNYRIK